MNFLPELPNNNHGYIQHSNQGTDTERVCVGGDEHRIGNNKQVIHV